MYGLLLIFGTKFTTFIDKSIIFATFVRKLFYATMNFLTAIIDSLVAFVRRNPLTVLVILVLALTAPALLRGLATVILYLVLGFVLFIVVVLLMMRWRLYKVQQQVRRQFEEQQRSTENGSSHFGPFGPFGRRSQSPSEGEVKIRHTGSKSEKRIADDVGDYVEFEETKEK